MNPSYPYSFVSNRRAPKTVTRYGQGRENMELNAINFLGYYDEV